MQIGYTVDRQTYEDRKANLFGIAE